ncbi:MAG: hypothetical protein NTW54_06750 [Bacteroidetes bacterium]|nr:hypothetical protein [Bacteroidota bacterium]
MNSMRIDGTLAVKQNFCVFNVSGMPNERKLLIRCIDQANNTLWEHTLFQKDLTDTTPLNEPVKKKKNTNKK